MTRSILTIEASAIYSVTAPTLEVLVNGVVYSSSVVTATTGVGSDLLSFTIDYPGTMPSSLSFRFNDGSAEGGRSLDVENVRINGQLIDRAGDMTSNTSLNQNDSVGIIVANTQYLYGREAIAAGDLGTATQTGTAGDDFIRGSGTDPAVIDAGAGNDRVMGLSSDDAVIGGDGNDYLFGADGNDIMIGGLGSDILSGDAGDDLLHGQDGNDYVLGGAGNDLLNGGLGNDVLAGDTGDDVMYGEGGDDKLLGDAGNDSMFGDAGADIMNGGAGDDYIDGGDGDDMIVGGAGVNEIYGGAGADNILGGSDIDTIDGGAGIDNIFAGAGNDIVSGGTEDDAIFGDAGDDTLNGDGGNDYLNGGAGADTIDGGDGNDIVQGNGLDYFAISSILNSNPGVTYSFTTGSFYQLVNAGYNIQWTDAETAAEGTTLNGIGGHLAVITTQAENDYLVANIYNGTNTFMGGSDAITEGIWQWDYGPEAGLQFWDEGAGSALNGMFVTWTAGQPNDSDGGQDYTYILDTNDQWADAYINGGGGFVDIQQYVIEWEGGQFSDDNAADILSGGAGNDHVYGWGGDDTLNGDAGDDFLFGGDGNDTLDGGADTDVLIGGNGDDTITGGAGNDVMYSAVAGTVGAQTVTAGSGGGSSLTTGEIESMYGVTYDATTGNFYKYVNGNTDFNTANTAAQSAGNEIEGVAGHLATITSSAENSFVQGLLGGDSWLGGSDTAVEDAWTWITGPENGTQFSNGSTAVGGEYENWSGGQPNDWGGGQDYMVIDSGSGQWADFAVGSTYDYVIEWEGSTIFGGGGGGTTDILTANFSSNTDGFSYADGVFGSSGGSNSYASGMRITSDGYSTSSGALQVTLGGLDNNNVTNMSGAYQQTFNLGSAASNVTLSFAYRVLDAVVDGDPFDGGEDTRLYADIDGTTYSNDANPYFFEITGSAAGASYDSGWQTVSLNVGALSAGSHTLSLGGLLTSKSWDSEQMDIRFDDLVLQSGGGGGGGGSSVTLLSEDFGTDTGVFTYSDGGFGGSDGGNVDVSGSRVTTDGGVANGALEVYVDGQNNSSFTNGSGSWDTTINPTDDLSNVQLTFSYRHWQDSGNDNNEDSQVWVEFNGTTYDALGGNSFVNEIQGAGGGGADDDTGWVTVTIDLPDLTSGASYDLSMGILHTGSSRSNEDAYVRFDDITLTGDTSGSGGGVSGSNDATSSGNDSAAANYLDGGAGDDVLYGSAGDDTLYGNAGSDALYSDSSQTYTVSDALAEISGLQFNEDTGSFYYYVSGAVTSTAAFTAADAMTLNGINGHIAHITSSTENSYIDTLTGTATTWMGATDSAVEGEWRWVGGKLDGQMFWQGTSSGSLQGGFTYENFNGGEPNDWSGGEDYLEIQNGGGWNDNGGPQQPGMTHGYVVEWEASEVFSYGATELNGGAGSDDLYGSGGADLFVFDSNSGDAFTNPDTVHNFDSNDGDALDISDILSGLDVNSGNISDYVDVSQANGVRVDVTGSASFGAGTTVATFDGISAVTDELTMLNNGNLLVN